MHFSVESVIVLLLIGLVIGLLPGTIVERTGLRLVGDVAIALTVVFVAGWLVLAPPQSFRLPSILPGDNSAGTNEDLGPRYEVVTLPLMPLRPLLKPVVFRTREEICDTLTAAALNNDLPAQFFIRLLYQESSFRPAAISSAGALGIAQFMPETAADRGLDNPFDPVQAIPASARLLRDLYRKFGNLGLAAAAYNAGPRRIEDWLARKSPLPQETQDYVNLITGAPAETWTVAQSGSPALKLPRGAPCQEAAGLLAWDGPDQIPMPPSKPSTSDATDHAPKQAANDRAKALDADKANKADKKVASERQSSTPRAPTERKSD